MNTTETAPCLLCGDTLKILYPVTILGSIQADMKQCANCQWAGYLKPNWLEQAYADAITPADTGILARNISLSSVLSEILLLSGLAGSKCLDLSGGYGLLVRLMRDKGFDFFWSDPYAQNLFAKGFDAEQMNAEFRVLTLFEVLEHLEDPLGYLKNAFTRYQPSLLVFSTDLYPGHAPEQNWWYLAPETGQHISFYSSHTIQWLACELGMGYLEWDGVHVFCCQALRQKLAFTRAFKPLKHLLLQRRSKGITSKTMADHRLMKQACLIDPKSRS